MIESFWWLAKKQPRSLRACAHAGKRIASAEAASPLV
jgi:hypothetical protein